MTFDRPPGKPAFTAPWFRWFLPQLTLPEGYPMRWAGHLLLMTEEFFAPELVHLLVLIPKGNWKTTWEAGLADWHLLTVRAPRVFAAAADKGQTKELFDFAAHFVDSEPELAAKLITRSSTMEIRDADHPGRLALKVLAQDDSRHGGKKQGLNLTLGLGDELHAWENRNLFVDLRSGGFKRREAARMAGDPLWWTLGKMGTITTEGYASESLLAEELEKFLGDPEKGIAPMGTVEAGLRVLDDGSVARDPVNGRLTIARYGEGRNVLLKWANREGDDTSDNEVVKLANPAPTATVESIQDARESLKPWEFLRYRCNVRTLGFSSWLPEDAWDTNFDPELRQVEHRTWEGADERDLMAHIDRLFEPGAPIVGAIDIARYRYTAAVVAIGPRADGRKVIRGIIWRSGGPDNPIKYEWPKAAIVRLNTTFRLKACGFDARYFDQAAEELKDDEGVPMEMFPQSDSRMCPAAGHARLEIIAAEFAHDGDPILKAHVLAGKAQDVGPNAFKVVQQDGNGAPPIDGCIAMLMANQVLKDVAADDGDSTIFYL